MEDSEKLTALKKAYADIILNTAKEAAARIMLSERRAMRFQRELVSAKEDALRMLLRLKQMLDSKVSEAEMTSSSQQKKIEELEAQLQEAEEIVRDLRAELREVQAELEKVTINQMHPLVEQNTEDENAAQEKELENRLDSYGSAYSVPVSHLESVATFDTRHSTVNGTKESSMCCVSHDHINYYIHNPDFASIITRRKKPELYRNGCTQRVRAFERSLFDGNISLLENVDHVQNEAIVRGDEGKVISVITNTETGIILEAKKPDELKVVDADADHFKLSLCCNKEIKQEREVVQSRLCSHQVMETNKPHDTTAVTEQSVVRNDTVKKEALVEVPVCRKKRRINNNNNNNTKVCYISCTKSSSHGFDNNNPSKENFSMACENEAEKDVMSASPKEPIDTTAMIEQSGSQNDAEIEEVFLQACSAWDKITVNKELLDKSDKTREDNLSTESLEVSTCRVNVEGANEPSDKLGLNVSDLDEKVSSQPVNDRFIKYTFQRKRKKESLSSPDVDCSPGKRTLKEQCEEKQNGHMEPQKSCTITESSRDSQRSAQVTRQLISLSEKKWWQ